MIQLLFPILLGGGLCISLFRRYDDRNVRWTGGILILLGTVCFALYAYGTIGVGLSSLILELFGKAGIIK